MLPISASIDFTEFVSNKGITSLQKDVISILNNAQREWLNKKKDFIDQQISKFYPLTDEQWQHVTDIVDDTVKKAKGHEAEVRKELFDLMEKWERKEKEGVRDE
mgnify:CR=1 FL=1